MNFDKASDRAAHQLITMDRNFISMNDVIEARHLLWELRYRHFKVNDDQYKAIGDWIEEQGSKLANFRRKHHGMRKPIDESIEPNNLTAEQRRRLAAQRKEPGVGGL